MRHFIAIAIIAGVSVSTQRPAPAQYPATIDTVPSHGDVRVGMLMAPATPEERERLRGLVPDDAPVARASVMYFRRFGLQLFLAHLGGSAYVLLGDFNLDRRIAPDERVPISGAAGAPPVVVHIPMPGGQFATYPVGFAEPHWTEPFVSSSGVVLQPRLAMKTSIDVVVRGRVDVDGRRYAFELPVLADDGRLHLTDDVQHLDTDGDGAFDRDMRSRERMVAHGKAPVFRIGERYVSIASADPASGRATFTARTAADYERIEIHAGARVPDFTFIDLDGKHRQLSDYRGKIVLLDFWGTWCGPCIAELPYLAEAYDTFRDRGFEIIGMDYEKPDVTPADFAAGVARVRAFVRDRGLRWPQARTESIKALYERRFQIGVWPTMVLIDREGRVISAGRADRGEPRLLGEALMTTLAAVMPSK